MKYRINYTIENKLKAKFSKRYHELDDAVSRACEFWSYFITPAYNIHFDLKGADFIENTVARTYRVNKPVNNSRNNLDEEYWQTDFHNDYLERYFDNKIEGKKRIVATIIHEVGHMLGIGGIEWRKLFEHGKIKGKYNIDKYRKIYNILKKCELEHDGDHFKGNGIMSENGEENDYIKLEAIVVMKLLGHEFNNKLGFHFSSISIDDILSKKYIIEFPDVENVA